MSQVYGVNVRNRLRPEQDAALAGLRRALSSQVGVTGQLDDAADEMERGNEQAARNQLAMLSTPAMHRQHLAMNPAGDVYSPTPGSIAQAGHEMVYGDTTGSGRQTPRGLGQLIDTGWAGFGAHFADKDRMRQAAQRGLLSARKAY